MEMNKRIETLEGDFKLLKGELKQTLTTIREVLMALKVQPSEGGILVAQHLTGVIEAESPAADSDVPELPTQDGDEEQPALEQPEETQEEALPETSAEDNMKEEAEVSQPTTQINLLANLIRWVSAAKKEIGSDQLSAFLEVYSIAGCLSSESKEVIQHVADVVAQQSADANAVDVWTRLTLELHGILCNGEPPLRLPKLSNKAEASDTEHDNANGAKRDKLVKLKLVLPGDDGEDKEFAITLSPEVDGKSL